MDIRGESSVHLTQRGLEDAKKGYNQASGRRWREKAPREEL